MFVNPRAAAIEWFRQARSGLFMHYRHEWVQLREKIPVAEYAQLKNRFTAAKFDAQAITDLTTWHHDRFCLFKSKFTDFHSVNSPAKRDLVGELAGACRKKGLGLCLYYSHGRDWKHSHAPNNGEWKGNARPQYDPLALSYAYGKDHDLQKYLGFVT